MNNVTKLPEQRLYIACDHCDGLRWYACLDGIICCACHDVVGPFICCPECESDRWFMDTKADGECVYCGYTVQLGSTDGET